MNIARRYLSATKLGCQYLFCVKIFDQREYFYNCFYSFLKNSGPCFIKLGQWMSIRTDIFDSQLCKQLQTLQSNTSEHSFSDTERIFLNTFSTSIEETFDKVDPSPIASGAIGQVYVGFKNNKKYAIKVQHPGLVEQFEQDFAFMLHFATFLNRFDSFQSFDPVLIVKSFQQDMYNQLDFRIEADNLILFNALHLCQDIVFPDPLDDYIGSLVLVESFEEGSLMSEWMEKEHTLKDRTRVCELLMHSYLKMIIVDKFVHADLHPGNILVKDDGTLVLLDAGLVYNFDNNIFYPFMSLCKHIVCRDSRKIAELIIAYHKTAFPNHHIVTDEIENFVQLIGTILSASYGAAYTKMDMGVLIQQIISAGKQVGIKFPSEFVLLMVGLCMCDGVCKKLGVELNLIAIGIKVLSGNLGGK
jgi:ubiquinone biosynthesis protein